MKQLHALDSVSVSVEAIARTESCPRGSGDLWILIGSAFYLLINLIAFPGVPILLGGDQVFFWMDAQRVLLGERIYRDFFQFTAPGTDLIYVGTFHLFGPRIWVPNLVVLVLGVLLGWTCFRIASQILPRGQAFLAASFFLVVVYGKLLNATHHWFSELGVLAAVYLLMCRRSATRIVLSGVLLGIVTFITQTRGPITAVAFIAYFVWDRNRTQASWRRCFQRLALLIAPMVATWLALSSYFIVTIGWRQLWYWQILYALRYQVAGGRSLGLQNALTWRTLAGNSQFLLVYLSLPFAYGFSLLLAWRERYNSPSPGEAPRMLLTFAGIATAAEVAQSPNWLRVYCVAAPAILLSVWVLNQAGKSQRFLRGLLWSLILLLAVQQFWIQRHYQRVIVQTPAGSAMTSGAMAEKLNWIGRHTRPGDFFFQAPWPGVYFPLQLHNPAFADDFMTSDVTRPEFVADSIRQLRAKRVQYILWSPQLNSPESPETAGVYHLAPFLDFLHENYRRVTTFQDHDEIWERKLTGVIPE